MRSSLGAFLERGTRLVGGSATHAYSRPVQSGFTASRRTRLDFPGGDYAESLIIPHSGKTKEPIQCGIASHLQRNQMSPRLPMVAAHMNSNRGGRKAGVENSSATYGRLIRRGEVPRAGGLKLGILAGIEEEVPVSPVAGTRKKTGLLPLLWARHTPSFNKESWSKRNTCQRFTAIE